ncbi:MAG: LPS export ABC transporter permease LptG [Gammaproteobacteria bacterium]|nr:LPS export ABC transporter permease LptG [Gammaproteobacteria bacterium]
MKILQKYITISLVTTTLIALFGLVALFAFFSIIDQMAETGKGSYTVSEALLYVLLTTPRLAYELFPIAAVIGSMATLGLLAHYSELVVIRTSGVSRVDLAIIMTRAALLLVALSIIVGELIAPISEEAAQQRRSIAMTDQISMRTMNGYWARDGGSFINIRKILPGNHVEDVYIYEFDQNNQLRTSIYARDASYDKQRWLLNDIEQTSISNEKVSIHQFKQAEWPSSLAPEIINFVLVQPQYLSFFGLLKYLDYLRENAQETAPYEQALWKKIIKPFSICAMVLLSILLVRCESRFAVVGQRIFFGTMIGVVFHICDQISGHLGMVYEVPAFISVTAPTVLLLGTVASLLRR